ncbi:MAG: FAD-dependent oxidoreductase [Acidimicrobiia bacterium]
MSGPPRQKKPIILAVDDDPQVLSAVRRDIRARYAADHRILAAPSGADALATIEELHRRGEDVAVFLVDQRMPEMVGTQFLLAAIPHFPDAKRVLLTAYADTDAAIASINEVGLDHYLLKPWDPPEHNLYPVIDDLLGDWLAGHRPAFEGITVVGARWSPSTHDTKDFLAKNQIPYRFLDIDRDPEASALAGDRSLPVVIFPDGEALSAPDHRTMASKAGLSVEATEPIYDVVVIGAGPAGLAAGVYGASEGLRTLVIERAATGGQAGQSSRIENYLGFPKGISGADLTRRATAQAQRLGAEIVTAADVVGIDVEGTTKVVRLGEGSSVSTKAVVVASGMTTRRLDIPGGQRFGGAGLYYGATSAEAATYRDEDVFVVGGANSAGQAAMMFSAVARSVTMVVRGEVSAKMSSYLIDQIAATPVIEVLEQTIIGEVLGDEHVEGLRLVDRTTGTEVVRPGSAVFVFVGAVPHTDFLREVVALDDHGFVVTGPDLATLEGTRHTWPLDRPPYLQETSTPGIFAAGDVRSGVVRRVASAVGQGSTCISMVHRYLEGV